MLTEDQTKFLNQVCLDTWTETNGVISVDGNVDMDNMYLTKIPVKFRRVNGIFACRLNYITSLEGGPKEVNLYYSCGKNLLTSLIGAPKVCNNDFYCEYNQLTSLEGCPRFIKYNLFCNNNPNLEYLWGIGRVEGEVYYDNRNEINQWIITCAKRDIIFPHLTLEENINWIKQEQKYSSLLDAPKEIRKYFSPRILNLVDSGIYNESRILDYKKFNRIC